MSESFTVKNVKCGGCVANIEKGLMTMAGIETIRVDIPSGQVDVDGTNLDRKTISEKLTELGYPEA